MKNFKIILIWGCISCLFYLLYLWINLQKYNQAPLDVKTFEGTNSPYHPDVVWFSKKWGGGTIGW